LPFSFLPLVSLIFLTSMNSNSILSLPVTHRIPNRSDRGRGRPALRPALPRSQPSGACRA
jgi:hypothetical protein